MKKLFLLLLLVLPLAASANDDKNSPVHQGTEVTITNHETVQAIAFEEQSIQVVVNTAEFLVVLQEYDPCAGKPVGECYCEVEVVVQGDLTQHTKKCYKAEGAPTTWPVHFYTAYWWTATP